MTDTQFDQYEKEFSRTQNALGYQPKGIIGFLIKISRGHLKIETVNNILVVITVVSFTISAIIFSNIVFSQKNNEQSKPAPISKELLLPVIKHEFPEITDKMLERLPESFYREDVPPDIASKLTQEIINSIPPRP